MTEPHICGCEWHGADGPAGDPDVECMYHAAIRTRVAELEDTLRALFRYASWQHRQLYAGQVTTREWENTRSKVKAALFGEK